MSLRYEIAKRFFLTAYPDGEWDSFKNTNEADWYWGDAANILALVRTALLSEAAVEAGAEALNTGDYNADGWEPEKYARLCRAALAAAIDAAAGDFVK